MKDIVLTSHLSSSDTVRSGSQNVTIYIKGLIIHPAAADSSAILKGGGSSGQELLRVEAKAEEGSVSVILDDKIQVSDSTGNAQGTELYCTLSGASATATVLYTLG